MTEGSGPERPVRRTRLRRQPGGRRHTVWVRLSDREKAQLEERAKAGGVSVPRLLVESALLGDAQTAGERRQAIAELLGARRMVAAVGNNLNQLTRTANATGELPPQLGATLHAAFRVLQRLDAAAAPFDRGSGGHDAGSVTS